MNFPLQNKHDLKERIRQKNYIYSHIRHISIRTISLLCIPLILLILIAQSIPFKEVFFPSELTYANSAYTKYSSGSKYVEITLHNAYYTGYDCIRRGTVYGSYYYCTSGNSCTFIIVDTSNMKDIPQILDNYTIKAKLVKTDKLFDTMETSFANDIGWNKDGISLVTSSVIIDETEYNLPFYSYLIVSFSILEMIICSFMIVNIIYFLLPKVHPACMTFAKISDRKITLYDIEKELCDNILMYSGNIILTENYLIATTAFSLELIPINKIVWAYKHSSWNKILWFKLSLTYTLNIMCKKKVRSYSPRNKKQDIDAILDYLERSYPSIIFGYSKEKRNEALKKASA